MSSTALREGGTLSFVSPRGGDGGARKLVDLVPNALCGAAKSHDRRRFTLLIAGRGDNWSSPDELGEAVGLAVGLDLVAQARHLAREGTRLFPFAEQLCRWDTLLEPPAARLQEGGPQPDISELDNWLRSKPPDLSGRWVAVVSGALVAVGSTAAELVEQVRAREDHPLVFRVPE